MIKEREKTLPLCSIIFLFIFLSNSDTTGSYNIYSTNTLESTTGHLHGPHRSFHINVHRKPAGGDSLHPHVLTHWSGLYKTKSQGQLVLMARFRFVYSLLLLPLCSIVSDHNIDSADPVWLALLDPKIRAHEQPFLKGHERGHREECVWLHGAQGESATWPQSVFSASFTETTFLNSSPSVQSVSYDWTVRGQAGGRAGRTLSFQTAWWKNCWFWSGDL